MEFAWHVWVYPTEQSSCKFIKTVVFDGDKKYSITEVDYYLISHLP